MIAAPLSIAIALMVVHMPNGLTWLTLDFVFGSTLVLYGLSLRFDDKPMRRGALVMLNLPCAFGGLDMQRADMALRGIVFTGVGVVMITAECGEHTL